MSARTAGPRRVLASFSWAWLALGAVFFVGVLLFSFLGPVVHFTLDIGPAVSPNSTRVATTHDRLWTMWKFWPAWFLGALFVWAMLRAKNESERGI